MKKLFFVLTIIFGLLTGAAFAQAISSETLDELKARIDTLREKISNAQLVINESKPRIGELEYMIENAGPIAEKMVADLQELVEQYKTGSDIERSLQKAKDDIKINIDRFREGSEVQQRAAERLRGSLKTFEDIDDRRDQLVGRAMAEVRSLSARRDDIEAIVIAEAYEELAGVYEGMLNGFETTVVEAEGISQAISDVSGLPRE